MGLFRKKQPGQFTALKFVGKLTSKPREFRDLIVAAESAPKDGTEPLGMESVSYSEIGMFVLCSAVFRMESNSAIDMKIFLPIFGREWINRMEQIADRDRQKISREYLGSIYEERYREYSTVLENHFHAKGTKEITDTGVQILWSLIVNATNKDKPSDFMTVMLLVPDLYMSLQDIHRIVDK